MNRTRIALVVSAVLLLMVIIPIGVMAQQADDPCATTNREVDRIVAHKATLTLQGKFAGPAEVSADMREKVWDGQLFEFQYRYVALAMTPDGYRESNITGWYSGLINESCGFFGSWEESVVPIGGGGDFWRSGTGSFVYDIQKKRLTGFWYGEDGDVMWPWYITVKEAAPSPTPHMTPTWTPVPPTGTPTWTPAPAPMPTGTPFYLPAVSKGN